MRNYTMPLPLAGILFIVGCSQTMYVKDGGTAQQFEADRYDCEYKAVMLQGGYNQMGVGGAIMARQEIARCLGSKGWREESEVKQKSQPGSHLTPEEIARIKSEINPK